MHSFLSEVSLFRLFQSKSTSILISELGDVTKNVLVATLASCSKKPITDKYDFTIFENKKFRMLIFLLIKHPRALFVAHCTLHKSFLKETAYFSGKIFGACPQLFWSIIKIGCILNVVGPIFRTFQGLNECTLLALAMNKSLIVEASSLFFPVKTLFSQKSVELEMPHGHFFTRLQSST